MKKILSIILAAMMVLGMLAGCTGNNTETQQPEAPSTPIEESTQPSEEPSVEPSEELPVDVTIKVAAIETAYGADMWKNVAEAFTAETGIKVELVTEKNLEDVLDPQMQARRGPPGHRP